MIGKKYQRRLKFKFNTKDKWFHTYWWDCDLGELPYDLKDFINKLVDTCDSDEIQLKIEKKRKTQ